jgi:large subunit ribosomal protein L9
MKVILNDHIEHLGERGESVEVKPGFARNYLLPKKLGYLDSPGNRKLFAQEQDQWQEMDLKRKSAAEIVRGRMKGLTLKFERRAGEKDVLFGSVTTADIARGLTEKGFEIDKRRINMAEVIKEIGNFEVEVRIHREIAVALPIHVVRPGEQVVVPEASESEDEAASEAVAEVDAEAPVV